MSPLILRTEVSVIVYINQSHTVNTNTQFWYSALNDLGQEFKLKTYPTLT